MSPYALLLNIGALINNTNTILGVPNYSIMGPKTLLKFIIKAPILFMLHRLSFRRSSRAFRARDSGTLVVRFC